MKQDTVQQTIISWCFLLGSLFLTFGAQAEIKVNLVIEHFSLDAESPQDLLSQMNQLKSDDQMDVWAHLDWNAINEVNFRSTARGCKLNNFDSEIDIVLTLPKWRNIERLTQGDQDWWDRFITHVTDHEHRHKMHLIDAINGAVKEYEAIGELSSCSQVRNEYLRIKQKYTEQARLKDEALHQAEGPNSCIEYLRVNKPQQGAIYGAPPLSM